MRYRKGKVEELDLPAMGIEKDPISNLLQRPILTVLDQDRGDIISCSQSPSSWAEEGAIDADDAHLSLAYLQFRTPGPLTQLRY